jgi:hypothetical protein
MNLFTQVSRFFNHIGTVETDKTHCYVFYISMWFLVSFHEVVNTEKQKKLMVGRAALVRQPR